MRTLVASWITVIGGVLAVSSGVDGSGRLLERVEDTYALVDDWAVLPDGVEWGPVSAVAADAHGNILALRRQGAPVLAFDADGVLQRSWDEGHFTQPHGLRVDHEGHIWATSTSPTFRGGSGHQVFKFDPDGKLLMTLGRSGEAGQGPDAFNGPTDVAVGPGGEFYVADGYGNSRVAKFDRDGTFLTEWGSKGTGPGQFNLPHSILIDHSGRVLVGDRENQRVQLFDTEGTFLDQWTGLGSPYSMALTEDDRLIVADGRNNRVTIASGRDGEVIDVMEGFEQPHWVAVDRAGNLYVAEVRGQRLKKLARR